MSLTKATYSMINGAPLNVLDYGADPTGVTDSATAIQDAIDAATTTGNALFIPAGLYLVGSQLTISRPFNDLRGFQMYGEGRGRSIFKYTGSGALPAMLEMIADGFSINNEISGIKLDLTDAPSNAIGLKINAGIWRSQFDDLYILRDVPGGTRTGVGIYMGSSTVGERGCFDNKFSNLYVNSFSKNLYFQGTDSSGNTITNCPVDHSYISGGDINWQADYYNGLSANNTQFELAVNYGFYAVHGETAVFIGGSIESPVTGAVGIGMDANTKSVVAICDFFNNSGGDFVTNGKIGHFFKTPNSGHVYPSGAEVRVDADASYQAYLRFFKNGVADARVRVASAGNAISITNAANAELFNFDVDNLLIDILNAAAYVRFRSGSFIRFFDAGVNTDIRSGAGSPEGAVTANPGSLYLRRDGGVGTSFYVKEIGSGNTGWAAK